MKVEGRTRIPPKKTKELGVEKDDTDTVIVFKEAINYLTEKGEKEV